jgi:hypothetical protein
MIVKGGCVSDLSPEIVAAYDAPFPEERYKSGARRFPVLVPTRPDDPAAGPNRRAWEVLRDWEKPPHGFQRFRSDHAGRRAGLQTSSPARRGSRT